MDILTGGFKWEKKETEGETRMWEGQKKIVNKVFKYMIVRNSTSNIHKRIIYNLHSGPGIHPNKGKAEYTMWNKK